jgi:hypothetical protein
VSRRVPAEDIEQIVGVPRHATLHYGRAVSIERRVYILHSQDCHDHYTDLRRCPYSRALDLGITETEWTMDQPVALEIWDGRLTDSDRGTNRSRGNT